MRFKLEKQKKIVFCVLDILDNCKSEYARQICINLSDYLIHRIDHYDFDILIGKDEDSLLRLAQQENYSHAVMISAGTSLGLSDRLFDAVEDQCQEDFFIAGHILDRGGHSYYKNACFELHQQFYIINLSIYKELNCPIVGQEEWTAYSQKAPIRSKEWLYDDPEIPVWMKPGTETKTYSLKLHGWNILNVALENDKKLLTLGESIRKSKKYLYYEYDHVFLKTLTEINYYQFFGMNFFAGWNSDNLRNNLDVKGPVDQYASVGIGFNWIRNLAMLGYTKQTKVIFTDINFNCLMFMKKMVEEWDGQNYSDFYWTNKPQLPNNPPYIPPNYKDQIEVQWQKFLGTFDDWETVWNEVRNLTYEYILIDYTSAYNLDWLEAGKNTLFNVSDLYNHSPFIAHHSVKYRVYCENNLLYKLKNKDPNINLLITSRAADGFYASPDKTLDKVSNFTYTKIEELNTPDWHLSDWENPSGRPLGAG